jgi:hypothetical protein
MWDLDTLCYLNEQAHLQAVERAKEASVVKPPVYPLSILARRLLIGPPSLAHLIDLFANSEVVKAFAELVREYLPEHEAEIMSQDMDGRMQKFCEYFNPRYFPLADGAYCEIDMEDFVSYIPVDLMGFTYEDYHNFEDFRPGYILMLSLVVYPYWDGYESDEELRLANQGKLEKMVAARVPIVEEVARLVGEELAALIPANGWSPEDLHRMTDGTNYEGCGDFADWVCSATGCMQLDATYEEYSGEEWRRELVEELTKQWPKVRQVQMKIAHMTDWLEDDPRTNFRELLAFLLDRKDMIVPKEQLPLPLDESGQVKPKTLMEVFSGEEENEGRVRPATWTDLEDLTRF